MRLLSLASALRSWGLQVAEVDGWQGRGAEPFNPIGCLIHHTAGPRGADAPSLNVCINGRPGLRGPLCQVLISRSGVCHIIASAKCNHAGQGGPIGPIGVDQGNRLLVGIEAENDGVGEPWPAVQVGAMVRVTAAVLDLLGQPRTSVWGHREYTPRKIDPAGIAMAQFRADVAAARPPGGPVPTTLPENPYAAETREALQLLAQHAGYTGKLDPPWFGPQALVALHRLKIQWQTQADTIESLVAQREAAEAEALDLRRQLQTGGRLPALLADLDAAIAKARA